ncbi:hypothetical protein SY88_09890 [Clostridiales bacterium PH28_bin88]|nr:hypothetical protein SY88_09890 [Clostridiales bacterium PH28_bin88]
MGQFSRRTQYLLILVAAAIIFGGGVQYARWQGRLHQADLPAVLPPPTVVEAGGVGGTPRPAAEPEAEPARIVVHVAGAVEQPGVYRLPAGSRVDDAVRLAVPTRDANLDGLNLAAVLVDGQQVPVPKIGEPVTEMAPQQPGTATGVSKKVNINTASLAELDTLPGIGPALAQRIIDYRTQKSPFRDPRDITNVSGIGEAKYSQIQDLITVN